MAKKASTQEMMAVLSRGSNLTSDVAELVRAAHDLATCWEEGRLEEGSSRRIRDALRPFRHIIDGGAV